MKILIVKGLKKILSVKYAVIKMFPIQNKITIVSRQSNELSLDIEMLQDEIKTQDKEIKVVVLCKAIEGGPGAKIGYCFHLIRQMWHVGTSKIVVLDSYCISVSMLKQREELKVIQMWHALGALKKFGLSIVGNDGEGRDEKVSEVMNMHKNYTDVIVSSTACIDAYAEAFGCDRSKIKVGSLPRVEAILDCNYREKVISKIHEKYPKISDKQTILYAPTFRKGEDISKGIEELVNAVDSEKYNLIIKKHPLMTVAKKESMEVLWLDEFSTNEAMMIADYIICDYSAVVFEAALMEKPLFFYVFDFETYTKSRDFYLDYERDMPGVISRDARQIIEAIEGNRFYLERVTEFADRYIEVRENSTTKLTKLCLNA